MVCGVLILKRPSTHPGKGSEAESHFGQHHRHREECRRRLQLPLLRASFASVQHSLVALLLQSARDNLKRGDTANFTQWNAKFRVGDFQVERRVELRQQRRREQRPRFEAGLREHAEGTEVGGRGGRCSPSFPQGEGDCRKLLL